MWGGLLIAGCVIDPCAVAHVGTCRYANRWEFADDIELMFRNCSFFNEDTSEVSCCYDNA